MIILKVKKCLLCVLHIKPAISYMHRIFIRQFHGIKPKCAGHNVTHGVKMCDGNFTFSCAVGLVYP